MPSNLPELPEFVALDGPWALTLLRLNDGDFGVLVASSEQPQTPRALISIEICSLVGWAPSTDQKLKSYLQVRLPDFATRTPLSPMSLVGSFAIPALRAALTGHLIAVNRRLSKFDLALQGTDGVVAETALRYQELTHWAESSSAWVLAHEYGIPVATIHNRLRLARERGLLEKPGTGARR